MKINTPSKKRSVIITASIGAVLLIGGVLFALWQNNNTPSNQELTEHNDKTSAIQPEQVEDDKNDDNNKEGGADLPQKSSNDTPVDTDSTTNPPAGFTPEKPQISRASQSGDSIKVVAMFQEESSGYCELKLSKAGTQTISATSNITIGPSYYVCSLEVTRSKLPTSGQWQAVVVHHIGNTSTKSNSVMVEVN